MKKYLNETFIINLLTCIMVSIMGTGVLVCCTIATSSITPVIVTAIVAAAIITITIMRVDLIKEDQ